MKNTELDLTKMFTISPDESCKSFFEKHKALTIWVRSDIKEKYDIIQKSSNNALGKKLKAVIELGVETAEKSLLSNQK